MPCKAGNLQRAGLRREDFDVPQQRSRAIEHWNPTYRCTGRSRCTQNIGHQFPVKADPKLNLTSTANYSKRQLGGSSIDNDLQANRIVRLTYDKIDTAPGINADDFQLSAQLVIAVSVQLEQGDRRTTQVTPEVEPHEPKRVLCGNVYENLVLKILFNGPNVHVVQIDVYEDMTVVGSNRKAPQRTEHIDCVSWQDNPRAIARIPPGNVYIVVNIPCPLFLSTARLPGQIDGQGTTFVSHGIVLRPVFRFLQLVKLIPEPQYVGRWVRNERSRIGNGKEQYPNRHFRPCPERVYVRPERHCMTRTHRVETRVYR
jgi:hypothetical protein